MAHEGKNSCHEISTELKGLFMLFIFIIFHFREADLHKRHDSRNFNEVQKLLLQNAVPVLIKRMRFLFVINAFRIHAIVMSSKTQHFFL